MARYIDADALLKKIYPMGIGDGMYVINAKAVKFAIDNTPTAGVVGVTRCKDCKKSYECMDGKLRCCHHKGLIDEVTADDYCSYGERKE